MTELGARHGFTVDCTKDGGVFTADRLREFDAFFFYTTGDLTRPGTDGHSGMPSGGKAALLEAVRSGKGFVGVHSASDTFHTQPDGPNRADRFAPAQGPVDPYIGLLGGEFVTHGKIQAGTVRVWDVAFPGSGALGGDAVSRVGEWYSLKAFAPDMHVIMTLDTAGMVGPEYARGPYPVTWARADGRGRVFYTALGHLEAEWQEAPLRAVLVGALQWAFGDTRVAIAPNLDTIAPRHTDIPSRL
ncbi:MAG: ThuA domain-containing protein [Gemmatimonadaceae bacterium]